MKSDERFAMKSLFARFGQRLGREDHAHFDAERIRISRSEDMREGLQAFFERRSPRFIAPIRDY